MWRWYNFVLSVYAFLSLLTFFFPYEIEQRGHDSLCWYLLFVCWFLCYENNIFFHAITKFIQDILEKVKNKDIQKYIATHYSTGILGTDNIYW